MKSYILKAEKALGKKLPVGAEVHHVDINPKNDANSNLVICESRSYHRLLHIRSKIIRAGGYAAADEIIQGTGWEAGKGCFVGCCLHEYRHGRFPVEARV